MSWSVIPTSHLYLHSKIHIWPSRSQAYTAIFWCGSAGGPGCQWVPPYLHVQKFETRLSYRVAWLNLQWKAFLTTLRTSEEIIIGQLSGRPSVSFRTFSWNYSFSFGQANKIIEFIVKCEPTTQLNTFAWLVHLECVSEG